MAINQTPTRGALEDREQEAFFEVDGKMHKGVLAQINPSQFPLPVASGGYSDFNVLNISTPVSANTEFTVTIPSTTKFFILRATNNDKLKLLKTSGGNEFTIVAGNSLHQAVMLTSDLDLIFKSNKSSSTIELLTWS